MTSFYKIADTHFLICVKFTNSAAVIWNFVKMHG